MLRLQVVAIFTIWLPINWIYCKISLELSLRRMAIALIAHIFMTWKIPSALVSDSRTDWWVVAVGVLSDHGMTWVDQPHVVNVASYLNKDWYVSIQGNTPANVYVKKGCAKKVYQALKDIDHVKVWMKKDVPEYLHYGSNSRDLIGSEASARRQSAHRRSRKPLVSLLR